MNVLKMIRVSKNSLTKAPIVKKRQYSITDFNSKFQNGEVYSFLIKGKKQISINKGFNPNAVLVIKAIIGINEISMRQDSYFKVIYRRRELLDFSPGFMIVSDAPHTGLMMKEFDKFSFL